MEKIYEEINIPVEEELTEEEILIDDESNEDFNILVEEETSIVNMDYLYAKNKPSINEVTLIGNKQLEDLDILPLTNAELEAIIDWDSW